MTRTPFILMLAAAAALAGCGKSDHTIVAGGEPADDQPSNAMANANVQLPPSIAASKTYRCKDNSLVRIDWLQGGKGAYLHGEGHDQTHLKVAEAAEGQPTNTDFTAEGGFVLKGNATASTVSLAVPGKGSQSCKA